MGLFFVVYGINKSLIQMNHSPMWESSSPESPIKNIDLPWNQTVHNHTFNLSQPVYNQIPTPVLPLMRFPKLFLELIESHNECVFLSILSHIPQSSHFLSLFISQFTQHQNTCDNSLIMRERWMMECDVWWMRNEGMLLIESHCWIEWDEWERREEEIDFEDWEEKWLFWERLSVWFMEWVWVDVGGCCWGDGLVVVCVVDIDELSVCLCFHPQSEREIEWGLIEELLKL